jgi:hypothetical protein
MSLHVHKLKRVIEKGEDGVARDIDYDFSDDLQHVHHVPGLSFADGVRAGLLLAKRRASRSRRLKLDKGQSIIYLGATRIIPGADVPPFIHGSVSPVD